MRGADFAHRIAFPYGIRWAPYWMGRIFWRRDPIGRIDLPDSQRLQMMLQQGSSMQRASQKHDFDIITDKDILRMALRSTSMAFANGYDAVWDDAKLMCRDFGFGLKDIREDLPVKLWYGKYDRFVPIHHGLGIAAQLGERVEMRVEDEAHSGIYFHWRREILESMLKHM
jgi:hypothetical protein